MSGSIEAVRVFVCVCACRDPFSQERTGRGADQAWKVNRGMRQDRLADTEERKKENPHTRAQKKNWTNFWVTPFLPGNGRGFKGNGDLNFSRSYKDER